MIKYILIYLAVINLGSFVLFGVDKRRAKHNEKVEKSRRRRSSRPAEKHPEKLKRRIPEKVLFVTAALGGSIGAIAGMWTFRHKTLHPSFVYGMPAILAAQLLIVWVAVRGIPGTGGSQ